MDLLCLEDASECFIKAYPDPVILDDDRVLVNLLHTEEKYVISSRYFTYIQTDLKIGMRSMVAAWMLEVSNRFPFSDFNPK